MGPVRTILRAVTGLVSIVVARNNLFEKPGERSHQGPLPTAVTESSPKKKTAKKKRNSKKK